MLITSLIAVMKHPVKTTGLALHFQAVQFATAGKSQPPEHEVQGVVHPVREQRECVLALSSPYPFVQSSPPAHRLVLYSFRVNLPAPISLIWKTTHSQVQGFVSTMILNPDR